MIDILKDNIWIYMVALNALTFFAFWLDKKLSQSAMWRVPEATLLFLCLMGGTIGGYISSQKFRHKTKKGSFRSKFYIVIFVQILAVIILLAEQFGIRF